MPYQKTVKPIRKIVLYDSNYEKHLFPLYRDEDIGANSQVRELLIESWNDDDKRTSSTQLKRGV